MNINGARFLRRLLMVTAAVAATSVVATATPANASISIVVKHDDYSEDGLTDGLYTSSGCLYEMPSDSITLGHWTNSAQISCGWDAFDGQIAIGDDTSDGVGDMVAVKKSDNCLYRWNGDGHGGFGAQHQVGCGWSDFAGKIAGAGDLNGDSYGDLMAIGSDGYLYRWFGNGAGGFGTKQKLGGGWLTYVSSGRSTLTGVGDINGDAKADLVAYNYTTFAVQAWYGNGTGGLSSVQTVTGLPSSLRDLGGLGDANGDGNGDVLVGGQYTLQVYKGNGAGGFSLLQDTGLPSTLAIPAH